MEFLGVQVTLPSSSVFSWPPSGAPLPIPPPPGQPFFDIPEHVYQAALNPKVPFTIAALYAITAKVLNSYNHSRNKKPWRISKTLPFKGLVIAHNVFLAIYSAWTWVGMFSAMRRVISHPGNPTGLAGTLDSLCKLHGAEGLGNAVSFNDTTGTWTSPPSSLDAGRFWNEGLAYYGWLFYLSKFYEVFDTLIILAKGKYSSTLQTYHHAGAMMCMWAGIRYMSSPIWLFVFFNSGIHAMMYTYYTVTALGFKVPMGIKRTLTTCQITQFLVGGSSAMLHSFLSYSIPVSEPVESATLAPAAAAATAKVPVASTASSVLGMINSIRGVGSSAAEAGATPVPQNLEPGMKSVPPYEAVPCAASSGETFAIWLNVLYLAPLTYLFVSFFITSYVRRTASAGRGNKNYPISSSVVVAEKAGWDAATNVGREVYDQGVEAPVGVSSSSSEDEAEITSVESKVKMNGTTS